MSGPARTIAWALAMSAALAICIGALLGQGRWDRFAADALVALLYSVAIGVPATLIFRRIGPRLRTRPPLGAWLTYVAVVGATTIAGTLAARGALVLAGVMTAGELWSGLRVSFAISLAIALPMTVGAATYGRLRRRITDVELEAERARALASEARLAALEARIRPHFLFNALNSAVALIPDDPARAEDVLVRLGSLLRGSLDGHARLVPLADELRMVTDYLEIERSRFGARLDYRLDVAGAPDAARIPAFAVQTLVENSVKHAVAVRDGGARIVVHAARRGDRVIVEVSDDGPGFAGSPWRAGHGLDGLRARVEALYGGAATLVIGERRPGATVTLELPGNPRELPGATA